MAPRLFSKLFKRKKPQKKRCYPDGAVGINESTCAINGDPFDEEHLPVPPPDEHERQLGTRPCNPQFQSLFFKLPPEIRELIYRELLGDRRVHVEYRFMSPSPFQPRLKGKDRKPRWNWCHRVCQESDLFPDDSEMDSCGIDTDRHNAASGWTTPPPGTKLQGVELLRCCQMLYNELIPILYGTNTFATARGVESPFYMTRLLQPEYRSAITSMDVEIRNFNLFSPPYAIPKNWTTTYPAFFDLFYNSFPNVRRLRLKISQFDFFETDPEKSSFDTLLLPWENLAASREWILLNLIVPSKLYNLLGERAKAQNRWTLSEEFVPVIVRCGTCLI